MGYVYYHLTLFYVLNCLKSPAVGYWDTEIKVPSVENPELTNVLPLRPGVGQNIATHAVSAARDVLLLFFSVLHAGPVKAAPCLLCSRTGKSAPFR